MKKIIALIMALVLAFGLVACGAGGNAATGSEETDGPKERVTRVSSTEWDGSLPLVQEGEDNKLTIGIRTNANVTDFKDNDYTRYLEEMTGVDLEFVVFGSKSGDAATQVSLMVAGGEELPDILLAFSGISKTLAKEYGMDGYFLDLSEYYVTDSYYMDKQFDLYYPTEESRAEFEEFMLANVTDPGTNAMYWYPVTWQNPGDVNLSHCWINQDWLDTLGLTAPTTIDELYDTLVAFRDQDPNGNGIKDEIPMAGRISDQYAILQWVMNAFTYQYDKYKYTVTDGVVSAPYHTDEYRQGVIFIRKLVDEGLLTPLTWTMSAEEMKALVNPTGDFTVGICALPGDTKFEEDHESMFVYEPIAPLQDYTGKGGWAPTSPDLVSIPNFITADCDNPRLAFRFLDFMNTSEVYLRGRWGVRGRDWEFLDEEKEGAGMLGGTARIKVLDPEATAGVNNVTWHSNTAGLSSESYWQYELEDSVGAWSQELYDDLREIVKNYDEGKQPEQSLWIVERSEEVDEVYSEANVNIQDYVKTAFAEFCNGVRDPGNDEDWNKYLADLDGLGYHEVWLPVAQESWDAAQTLKN